MGIVANLLTDRLRGARWDGYFVLDYDQLSWWAEAAGTQRSRAGAGTEAFVRDLPQRDAP